jgi:anti-sigma factor RsiW
VTQHVRQSDLEAYLDEALPPEEMARIELALRKDPHLIRQMAAIHSRRNAGVHSLGEIWRRGRLSCPSREQLGSYLLEALPDQLTDYVTFHLEMAGCRYCRANLTDLKCRKSEHHEVVQTRQRKYFQSSVGHLRPRQ